MKKKHYARTGLIVAGCALLFLILFFVLSALFGKKEPQYAPDITGVTADGHTLYSLSDNLNETGTVLIFFNHDTGNAIETLQLLSRVVPEYDVDVIAVATGEGTIEEQIAIMKENEITVFPHTLFDLEGEMAAKYNVHGTPITYFIDKTGQVQDAFVSVISEKSMRKALAAIA